MPEIIRGQWLALRRRFLRPMIAVLMLDFVLMAVSLTRAAGNDAEDEGYFIAFAFAVMLMLVADAAAIGWVGMWQAMVEKKPRHRRRPNHFPHPDFAVVDLRFDVVVLGVMGALRNTNSPPGGLALASWFFFGIVIDVGFGLVSREKLLAQFRVQAARQPEESLGILGRLGRFLGKMAG